MPLDADLVRYISLERSLISWSMTSICFPAILVPWFIIDLIIVFSILYLIKQTRKNRSKQK